MDAITGFMSAHSTAFVIGIIILVIIILNFIFKSIAKLLIAIVIIALITFGYFYLKNPTDMPKPLGESVEFMKSGIDQVKDKSKSFVKDSKDLYDKSKSAKDVGKMLDSSKKTLDKELKK